MKRTASLGLGLALCAAGVLIALSPGIGGVASVLTRFWPVVPIVAGLGSLAGFALRRQPRSPFWGAVLLAGGGLALAVTLQSAASPLALYGRFWPLLLAVVALVEILKHYTHSPALGDRPPLFSAGKLLLVALVVVSGLAADRIAEANPNLLARMTMPAGLDRLRDQLFGEVFVFDPIVESAELPEGGTLLVANRFGDVSVEGIEGERVEVTLTPRVRAYERDVAAGVAARLRLVVEQGAEGLSVSTNRDEIDHEIATDMKIRVPRGVGLRVTQAHGAVTIARVAPAGGVRIDASHAPISIRDVAAPIEVVNGFGAVKVEQSSGSLDIRGRNGVAVKGFDGAVRLEDSDSVSMSGIRTSAVDLVSVDHASVSIEDVEGEPSSDETGDAAAETRPARKARVSIEGSHTSVRLRNIAGDVVVKTTHDDVRATDIHGSLEIEAVHAKVDATNVSSLKVRTSHDDVVAKNVPGPVEIVNDHGDVRVSGFSASCTVRTSYDSVRLEAGPRHAGDIIVENEHGAVYLRLPVGQSYDFDPQVQRGDVRIDSAFGRAVSAGVRSYRVVLKTSYDDIVVRPGAGPSGEEPA